MISSALPSKPVLIFGAGIQDCREEAIRFANQLGAPVCLTWGAADLLPWDHPLRVGTFGTHGNKYANLAIQNADFILSVGSRLDTKATGSPASSFAPKARIIMVDIDPAEIAKFQALGREVEGICTDARDFLSTEWPRVYNIEWLNQVAKWKAQYPVVREEHRKEKTVNPYYLVEKLSNHIKPDDVIVSDTGCSLGWMMQAYRFNGSTRFIHAFNNTPMGYGLPAAIGAAFATSRRVVLVTGDGGLAVNITELATVDRHSLPIKVLLFNNRGHAMCRQTQRQWMGGAYPSTSEEGGLACPSYMTVATGYKIPNLDLHWADSIDGHLKHMMDDSRPFLLNVNINPDHGIEGQIKFGEPLAEAA